MPYVPIATTLRTGISVFTYCDRLTFGITGDYDSTPDLDVLARGIEEGVAELVKVAAGWPPAPACGHDSMARPIARPASLMRCVRGYYRCEPRCS